MHTKYIDANEVQPENVEAPIVVTALPIVAVVRATSPLNAEAPMVITAFGIVTDVRAMQLANAEAPIEVTPLPMTTEVSKVQPENADAPMVVTLPDIDRIFVSFCPSESLKQFAAIVVTSVPTTKSWGIPTSVLADPTRTTRVRVVGSVSS